MPSELDKVLADLAGISASYAEAYEAQSDLANDETTNLGGTMMDIADLDELREERAYAAVELLPRLFAALATSPRASFDEVGADATTFVGRRLDELGQAGQGGPAAAIRELVYDWAEDTSGADVPVAAIIAAALAQPPAADAEPIDIAGLVAQLRDDEDSAEFGDGYRVTLSIRPDDRSVIDEVSDCDCYGKMMWTRRTNGYGHGVRPDGYDGAARILERDGGSVLWWQPHPDTIAAGPAAIDEEDRAMRNLLVHGFSGTIVTLEKRCTCCGDWNHVTDASLWGTETESLWPSNPHDYLGELVSELLADVLADANLTTTETEN